MENMKKVKKVTNGSVEPQAASILCDQSTGKQEGLFLKEQLGAERIMLKQILKANRHHDKAFPVARRADQVGSGQLTQMYLLRAADCHWDPVESSDAHVGSFPVAAAFGRPALLQGSVRSAPELRRAAPEHASSPRAGLAPTTRGEAASAVWGLDFRGSVCPLQELHPAPLFPSLPGLLTFIKNKESAHGNICRTNRA
ncbi:hypothetical protein J1605_019680 [Eschrichtius robustus]|uniref:Uncharacterized protein n=1 Tax=Eschrichtius robustus TaxID=9764 RepID=A0AB34HI21_ESCRO|nr:hypothetical protein J1605_019680 [Eschrichtius robustus]